MYLNCQAYLFNDYWEDIGTIKSFFDANLALTEQVSLLLWCGPFIAWLLLYNDEKVEKLFNDLTRSW